MKKQLHQFLVTIYGIVIAMAVLVGAIVAVLFFAGFVINGQAAVSISDFNLKIMNFSKQLACYAILFGLIDFYLMKDHHLTIDQTDEAEEEKEAPLSV